MNINKRLLLLFGIAITAVLLNHSSLWSIAGNPSLSAQGSLASVNASVPPSSLSFAYFFLVTIKKLTNFAVPAFLFASGFFAGYAGRKTSGGSQAKIILNRVLALAIPYLIWSVVIFLINPFQEQVSLLKLVGRVLYGGLMPEYYFVPLIIQFTILAPLLVSLARDRSRLLLVGAALIQLSVAVLTYASLLTTIPYLQHFIEIRRIWSLFPTWAFFFPLGMVVSFHTADLQKLLARYRMWLLAGTTLFALLAMLESQYILTHFGSNWWDNTLSIPSTLYCLGIIAVFLGFDLTGTRLAKPLMYLSNKTFAIYLIHPIVTTLVLRLIAAGLPGLMTYPLVLLLLLLLVGFGVPLLLITLGRNYFGGRVYKYLFG